MRETTPAAGVGRLQCISCRFPPALSAVAVAMSLFLLGVSLTAAHCCGPIPPRRPRGRARGQKHARNAAASNKGERRDIEKTRSRSTRGAGSPAEGNVTALHRSACEQLTERRSTETALGVRSTSSAASGAVIHESRARSSVRRLLTLTLTQAGAVRLRRERFL